MKLFKFSNQEKNKKRNVVSTTTRSSYNGSNYSGQIGESQILLKSINTKKRSFYTPKRVLRKNHGVLKKILIAVFLLGLGIFVAIKLDVYSYFEVDFVNVEGTGSFVNTDDVKAIVEKIVIGQSIFPIKEEDIVDLLTKNFLGAKTVVVQKDYPNSIKILIEERVPLAIVHNNSDDNFLIDSEGYVLGLVSDGFSDLPKIQYEGPVIIGTFLEKDMIPVSVQLLKFAEQEELKISSMSFYPNHVKVFVGGSAEVFIGYDKDSEKSLKTVSALIKTSEAEGKMLKKIDLRYDKVIVLYE